MNNKVDLIKEVRGINTFTNVVDTEFRELVSPVEVETSTPVTVPDFFSYYEQLFFDIPLTGDNSHTTLIQRSTQYLGGTVADPEKQALIEEINSLKQQIIELSETYITVGKITQ